MHAFTILCFSFLVSLVHASPLLSSRDVFSPHITSPNENTVWPVGTKQTVTWETADIPPDSQLTNPNGKIVLGHLGPTGGLNLQLDTPLAQNFKLRLGKIEIKVPFVPPRDDYIIVLFGDSGNASPAFAITRITNGGNSTHSSSSATGPSSSESLITTPIPITGSVITGGESSVTGPTTTTSPTTTTGPTTTTTESSVTGPTTTETLPSSVFPDPLSTQTAPVPQTTGTTSSGTSGAPAPTSNSAWASSQFNSMKTLSIGVASLVLVLVL